MSRQQINLSVIEENPSPIPENVERIGMEALQIFWQTSQHIAKEEIKAVKKRYQQYEAEVLQQRQAALDKAERTSQKLAGAHATIEVLTRENKSLQVDINRKNDTLKNAAVQKNIFEEKITEQEHEIKRLTEEVGRSHEMAETSKKRLYEVNRQLAQEIIALRESREEAAVNLRTYERIDKDLKAAIQESKGIVEKCGMEQRRSAVAEALVQEKVEAARKYEASLKLLKQEKQELRESLEAEIKVRLDMEKRVVGSTARADSQEAGYKERLFQLEQELEIARSDVTALRNGKIKAEGALERERKALERLETKLVAASSATI